MTVDHCERKSRRGTVEFSTLPLRAVAMGNPTCRKCDRAADSDAYCSSCAATIMARALIPLHGGRRKRSPRTELARP